MMTVKQSTLEGSLLNITFRSEETGYTVFRIKNEDGECFTAVGNIPRIQAGERIVAHGEWKNHPKFGRQFTVQSVQVLAPNEKEASIRYLASGLFKGIGLKTAERIVKTLGPKTLQILEKDPTRLQEVSGLGKKKLAQFLEDWKEHLNSREVLFFLHSLGVSAGAAMRIFQRYGQETESTVRENPWVLAEEIWGIGFAKADEIARSMKTAKDSPYRIEAGISYTLGQATRDGHVFLPRLELLQRSAQLLWDESIGDISELLLFCLDNLIATRKMVEDEHCCYTPRMYLHETGIAKCVMLLLQAKRHPLKQAKIHLETFEKNETIQFSKEQQDCILDSTRGGIFLLTGGPGTGKTTALRGILHLLERHGRSFLLAAPTGRAAKRMSELTGAEAKTIHRLLEYNPQDQSFAINRDCPLDERMVIVDEASMIDTSLMYALCEALGPETGLLLIGDEDQLPPVGPGNVLRELLATEAVPRGRLQQIFRQEEGSHIVLNAHRINRGKVPEFHKKTNFHYREIYSPEEGQKQIVELAAKHLPKHLGYDPLKDIQVLTPMHKGPLGTRELNLALQEKLNPPSFGDKPVQLAGTAYRPGDKVMQLKNNYDKNIFNGDVGFVHSISKKDSIITIDFDEQVEFDFNEMDQVGLAYAVTVHKSQGSEYPVCILALDSSHHIMLQRNLLYTAVTRAKERLFLVSSLRAIHTAVQNHRTRVRHTRLSTLIGEGMEFIAGMEEA